MWPTIPPSWLLPWCIWRLKYAGIPGSPPVPEGTPKTIPPWAWGVLKWVVWCRNGRIPSKRPISTAKAPIPNLIPKWAWTLYKQILIAVPIEPPPPPPPPPEPRPPNSWTLPWPIAYTYWGPRLEWREDHDFRLAVAKMVDAGVETIALGIGQYPAHYPDLIRERGKKVALWTPLAADGDAQAIAAARADGYIPQIEGEDQFVNALRQFQRGTGAGISRSVVTTFSGLDTFTVRNKGTDQEHSTTEEVEALADAGCTHAQVECYTGDMVPRDVGDLMWSAGHHGFYYSNPVIGLSHREYEVSDYQPDLDRYGKSIGVYLAEPMRPSHWQAVAAL